MEILLILFAILAMRNQPHHSLAILDGRLYDTAPEEKMKVSSTATLAVTATSMSNKTAILKMIHLIRNLICWALYHY